MARNEPVHTAVPAATELPLSSMSMPWVSEPSHMSEKPDATVYDHLGDIYAALEQLEKAREAWRKSLSVEPNEEVRKKLEASGRK